MVNWTGDEEDAQLNLRRQCCTYSLRFTQHERDAREGQGGLEEKGQKNISRRITHRVAVGMREAWFTATRGEMVGVEEQDRKQKNLEATSK